MKKLLLTACIALIPITAYAARIDSTVDATDDLVQILELKQGARNGFPKYEGTLNIGGTFNGCTIHYLLSTDGGTTKNAFKNKSGSAVTSTAGDNFGFDLGWPSGSASTILYASAAGCSGAPSLAIDVDAGK